MEKKTKCILVGLIVIMLLIGFLFFKYYFVKDVKEMLPISNEEVLSTNIVKEEDKLETRQDDAILKIELQDLDGKQTNFSFTYQGETFKASFGNESWHIVNSYKIKKEEDIKAICQALIQQHPVLGRDRESYRTAEDMTYEWLQHNLAYEVLPEGNRWKEHAKDVDLDPEDQGRSLQEMYEARTGKQWITSNNDDNK